MEGRLVDEDLKMKMMQMWKIGVENAQVDEVDL